MSLVFGFRLVWARTLRIVIVNILLLLVLCIIRKLLALIRGAKWTRSHLTHAKAVIKTTVSLKL